MKTTKNILGTIVVFVLMATVMVACDNKDTTAKDVVDQTEEFVEDQSENLSEKMEEKREKVNKKLAKLKEKADPTEDDKMAITFLEEKKSQLNDWLQKSNKEVTDEANDAMDDMQDGFNDLSEEIDEFFEKKDS